MLHTQPNYFALVRAPASTNFLAIAFSDLETKDVIERSTEQLRSGNWATIVRSSPFSLSLLLSSSLGLALPPVTRTQGSSFLSVDSVAWRSEILTVSRSFHVWKSAFDASCNWFLFLASIFYLTFDHPCCSLAPSFTPFLKKYPKNEDNGTFGRSTINKRMYFRNRLTHNKIG